VQQVVVPVGASATVAAAPAREPEPTISAVSAGVPSSWFRQHQWWFAAAVVVGIALLSFLLAGRVLRRPRTAQQAPGKVMLVVLPFQNLSGDSSQEYLSDGLTEELSAQLGNLDSGKLGVIGRTLAMTYKNSHATIGEVGKQLGVDYVLEGSVRRSGNDIRVNAQLVDAETGAHLWAERFDRDTSDLFTVQNEITGRIVLTLHLEMVGAEAARPIEHPDAMDYILRGRAAFYKSPTRENYAEAVGWFERALSLDSASVEAKSLLASILAERALARMTDTSADDLARAEGLVSQVLTVSPRSPIAHYAFGQVLRATRRNEQCIPEYQEALAFNRNWADALAGLGWCKFWVGLLDEAIELHEQAVRLSPRDPQIGYWYHRIGMVHLLQSRIQEAIPWLEKGRSAIPTFPLAYSFLGAAYALNGEPERAIKELAETYRLSGKVWVSTIADMKVSGYWGPPKIRALYESVYFVGLRKLGVPEE
jgi:TolB-like protein/tetratricopeptide (TPR) repeat protein